MAELRVRVLGFEKIQWTTALEEEDVGGGGGLAMGVVRPAVEVKRRGSTAGRPRPNLH